MKARCLIVDYLLFFAIALLCGCEEERALEEIAPSLAPLSISITDDTPVGAEIGEIEVLDEGSSPVHRFTLDVKFASSCASDCCDAESPLTCA